MAERLSTTLGMTQLAQTWIRRLGQTLESHDALVGVCGPPEVVGHRFPLDRAAGRILLGRGTAGPRVAHEPVCLPSAYVSEPHAALEVSPDGWSIVDLDSSNHTYVGTVKASRARLVYGDEIRLGDVVLVFVPAERASMPPHVVDGASGLLAARVFVAEATRLVAEGSAGPDLGLLLVRVIGLRERLAAAPSEDVLVRRIGEILLGLFGEEVILGRLEADLFAAAFPRTTEAELQREGDRTCQALAQPLATAGLRCRGVVIARGGEPTRVPQLLACAMATVDQAFAGGEEGIRAADLEPARLLADEALLAAVAGAPELPLLVVALEDEDRLRHHLGHDRLEACRWQLRRLVSHASADARFAGVLADRVFVIGTDDAERLTTELARQLGAGQPEDEGLRFELRTEVVVERPVEPAALRRRLLRAPDEELGLGQRETVEGLPSPVAASYGLIWVVSSATARVKTILDAAEMMTRFVAAATLAAVAQGADREAVPQLRRGLAGRLHRRLPMGEWLALLRELAPALPTRGDAIAEVLQRALGLDRRGPRFAHLVERELLPQRNRFAHRQLAPTEARSAREALELLEPLNALVRCLAPLRELQLLSVLESRPRRSGGTRATIRVHTGPRESFEVRQVDVRSPAPMYCGSSYLATLDYRHALELLPLVRFTLCPRCDREEIFLADGIGRSGEAQEMVAATTGHRLRWTPSEEDVPERLGRLLGG